jgi:hypothetical protein
MWIETQCLLDYKYLLNVATGGWKVNGLYLIIHLVADTISILAGVVTLIPVWTTKAFRKHAKTVTWFLVAAVILIAISAGATIEKYLDEQGAAQQQEAYIGSIETKIETVLCKRDMNFDEIAKNLDYVKFDDINDAIDKLDQRNAVTSDEFGMVTLESVNESLKDCPKTCPKALPKAVMVRLFKLGDRHACPGPS